MKRALPLVLIILVFLIFLPAVNASPIINYVSDFPGVLEFEDNVTIRADIIRENVTDPDCNIDKVLVNLTYLFNGTQMNETLEMTNITNPYELGGLYDLVYTLNNETETYYYEVFVNDSIGNYTVSDTRSFSIKIIDTEEAVISIEVAPCCGVGFSFYFIPEEVVRGQTVFFIQINENIGNMVVNETSEMHLKYENNTVVWGPHYDDTIELQSGEDDLHYGLWKTYNDTPLGFYYWHGITRYIGMFNIGNNTYNWPNYNQTANCTEVHDGNQTECSYLIMRTSSPNYGREHKFNTTSTSSVNVSGQNMSTSTYHGTSNISGTIYNAYTFYMENCTKYCYACISEDTNVTDDECGYSGYLINNNLGELTVTSLDSGGSNVTFVETFMGYTDRYIISDCEVNGAGDNILCSEIFQCNGSAEISDVFEVVVEYGGQVEQPSPEPYPEPSPSPSPKPTPEPGPIEINIYPVEPEVSGMQEQLTPVEFVIENLGSKTVNDITLVPIVGEDWIVENAQVDTIAPKEKLNRTLFIQPTYKVEPSVYAIPVQAISSNGDILDMTYFWFEVLPGKFLAKIKIVESPSEITLDSDSWEYIPILVKNIGKKPLTGIKAKLENIEECILNVTSPEIELNLDEENGLNLKVKTMVGPKTCNAMLIVESDQKAYAFAKIKINVAPPSALLPFGLPLIPLLVVIFLILLTLLIILRRRGKYVGILYPIVSASTFILLVYIFLWYLGLVPLF